eukprot:1132449-Pyramimonas_sp.AAC.2
MERASATGRSAVTAAKTTTDPGSRCVPWRDTYFPELASEEPHTPMLADESMPQQTTKVSAKNETEYDYQSNMEHTALNYSR